jgi:hypothetical protein
MIRFSTVAANADVLGDDTPLAAEPQGADRATRRAGPDRPEHRRGRAGSKDLRSVKPGKDINAPGFLKDEDASKPS